MFRHFIVFYTISFFIKVYGAEQIKMDADNRIKIANATDALPSDDMEWLLETFEKTAKNISKQDNNAEITEDLYNDMFIIVQEILDLNVNPKNVEKFIYAKGLDRIVAPHLGTTHKDLRHALLVLTIQLFDVAPTITKISIPIAILDKVLDIFEEDRDINMKGYALDVLDAWLPGNPKVQARVMMLKGLEPFYDQIEKLDVTMIRKLLDLFIKILEEHEIARRKGGQKTREDAEKLIYYQRVGLIERMSTSNVCNGLLKIFETALLYPPKNNQVLPSVFELVKKIKPYCLKIYKGKPKPIEVFEDMFQFVEDSNHHAYFEDLEVNVTDVRSVIIEFIENLRYTLLSKEL